MESLSLKTYLSQVLEPRRISGNFRHKLVDILVIGLCTVIVGGEDFGDMEEFGISRETWLKGFLELKHGIPDSDTFRRVFEKIDSAELSKCLNAWLDSQAGSGGRTVNIDGKTICGSGNSAHSAYHVVSAWVHEHEITLGEVAAAEKSNEITAIPDLLELIDIEGDIVTIDAMGCQRKIADKILSKKADFMLAVKENQHFLYESIDDHFNWLDREGFPEESCECWIGKTEKNHGRIERREVICAPGEWLSADADWAGIKTIIRSRTVRLTGDGEVFCDRFYISSFDTDAEGYGYLIKSHWSIENRLHWMLDVVFREDGARARKDNSPLNMNVLRKIALSTLKSADAGRKLSVKRKSLKAALDSRFLEDVIFKS